MPNIRLKLSDVLGAWFVSALVLLIAPILFFPFTVIGWLAFGFASPAAVYSFTYDKDHMAVVGVLLMLLLAWKEGFKASLSDAAALAKYEYETDKRAYSFDSSGMERESGTQAASRALGICLSPVIVIVR